MRCCEVRVWPDWLAPGRSIRCKIGPGDEEQLRLAVEETVRGFDPPPEEGIELVVIEGL